MIPMSAFATQFFITGFLYNLPFNMAVRVWDSFWLRGYDYWYAVALSIFKNSQGTFLSLFPLFHSFSPLRPFRKYVENGPGTNYDFLQRSTG